MGQTWIIDVLTDLRRFATKNDLTLLADQLAQAQKVAATEIASQVTGVTQRAQDNGEQDQGLLDGAGKRDRA